MLYSMCIALLFSWFVYSIVFITAVSGCVTLYCFKLLMMTKLAHFIFRLISASISYFLFPSVYTMLEQ